MYRYRKSVYFKQTHNSYGKVLFNKGVKGEYLIWKCLRKLKGDARYLFNCYIPKDNGETTEVDIIMLHEAGIYVFESKNYSGWIFGTETQQFWTQTLPKGRRRSQKERFFNPIIQNKVHIKWLNRYLDKQSVRYCSYIVFSNRCTLKDITLTSGQHRVINRYNLLSTIKADIQSSGKRMTVEELDELYTKLQPLTQVEKSQKLSHVKNVKRKQK